ncbi:MAG TPA: hypothetical protein VLB44_20695 [Kofleriaceae bacterium]|nr:hypothetical protein [Kofleriaceae bacterium]
MKTAISLPDELFHEAEAFARRVKKSRSELYQEALREYLARHDEDTVTEEMNRVADSIETHLDEFGREAARRALGRTKW